MLARMKRNCTSCTLLVGCKVAQALWKIVWQFLIELNMYLSYNLEIIFLGIYPRKMEFMFAQKLEH